MAVGSARQSGPFDLSGRAATLSLAPPSGLEISGAWPRGSYVGHERSSDAEASDRPFGEAKHALNVLNPAMSTHQREYAGTS
jgi:hypothetical protein